MDYLLEIAGTGLTSVLLHRLRSVVCVAAVVVVLFPYLVGLAISKGIEAQAEDAARFGADLYVGGSQFGRPVPLPLDAVAKIRGLEGVTAVVPRIVGELPLGKDNVPAVLVGLPPEQFAGWGETVEGELPRGEHELVVGTALARRLALKPGDTLPPLTYTSKPARLVRIVGVFRPDAPLWQANLVLTTFDTAAYLFDQPSLATDLLVWCRTGYERSVTRTVLRDLRFPGATGQGTIETRVTGRDKLRALLPRGLLHREGIFNLHFVLAFVVGILVLLVTSGLGLSERVREIGILKATGWQTDEVLLRAAVESFCLSLAGACVALLLAWAWLRLLNGYGIAAFFLAGSDAAPAFRVPFELAPVPALLAFVLSFVIVSTGTLYSAWRAARTPPREAMRA